MSDYRSVNKINSLKQGIENLTGETYTDLTSAIKGLKDRSATNDTSFVVDTSKITNFLGFCSGNRFNEHLDKLDTSKGTDFSYMFNHCTALTTIPQLNTSKGTNFSYMFRSCIKLTTIPQLDTSNGTNFEGMFNACYVTHIPQLNTSKGTNFSYMFGNAREITHIPQLDTSNGTNFDYMFESCIKLTYVPTLDISKGNSFYGMFRYCSLLREVGLTVASTDFPVNAFNQCSNITDMTIGEGWKTSIYLNNCSGLSQNSLHSMIENLADLTGQQAKTFGIGATNIAKLDDEHKNMLLAKNWNYS